MILYLSRSQAYFHTPFSMLALCAEGCASYTFPRILGKSKGNEMLMLNHKLSADEAYRFNFVSEVYKRSELDAILWPKIQEYARLPKESIRVTKKLINSFEVEQLQKSCDCELEELYKRFESDDFGVAVAEFMMRKSKLWSNQVVLSSCCVLRINFIERNRFPSIVSNFLFVFKNSNGDCTISSS